MGGACTGIPLHQYTGDNPNFGRSVLGCIEADLSTCYVLVKDHFAAFYSLRSTRLARFGTAQTSQFAVFCIIP